MSTSVWIVLSYPTMDIWRSVILGLSVTTRLSSVILITLHLLLVYTNSGGEWYASNGDRVGGTPAVPGFTRNRGAMVVRLGEISGTPLEGIYRCEIEDADETLQTVYVGLYNAGAGRVIIIPYATLSLLDCRGH